MAMAGVQDALRGISIASAAGGTLGRVANAAKTTPRAFWVGADGEAAAQASGALLLKPSQAALNAAKAGDWSVMRAESAAWAKGASGDVLVFFGNGKGRIFLNDELPEFLKNMDAGKVKSIQIDF
jgi:hypothetical protein